MVAVGTTGHDHAVNQQSFDDVHYRCFIAAPDVGAAGKCPAHLTCQFAVMSDAVVDQLLQLRRHRTIIDG